MTVKVKIEKWEDLSSTEIIFKLIKKYEYVVGEDFVDQNESIVDEVHFAYFLLGRGLITQDLVNSLLEHDDATLQYFLDGYKVPYAIFPWGEGTFAVSNKKYHLLAEIIESTNSLKQELFEILSETKYQDREGNQKTLVLTDYDFTFTGKGLECGAVEDEWQYVITHSIEEVKEEAKEIERKEK